MTEHKYTDDEIIRALECCFIHANCSGCPQVGKEKCLNNAGCEAVNLINRQKAEIAEYQKHIDNDIIYVKKVKAEAIKEFAERLVAIYENDQRYDRPNAHTLVMTVFRNIDDLVKEMTEGKE